MAQLGPPQKTPEQVAESVQSQYENMDAETSGFYVATAEVMRQCLFLENPACVESGLHGLGHLATFQPKVAVPVIDVFLKNATNQSPELIGYAKQARTGMIL